MGKTFIVGVKSDLERLCAVHCVGSKTYSSDESGGLEWRRFISNFHLVEDIAALLGPAPRALKEAEEYQRSEAEAERRAEEERLQQPKRQPSKEEASRKLERKS
jgi:hypothetical protein